MYAIDNIHTSANETADMSTLLRKLQQQDSPRRSSSLIETMFQSLIVDKEIEREESKFDFIMEDGVEIIAAVIKNKKCSSEQAAQGFRILFAIAEESYCHWLIVFHALGEMEGILRFLENHRLDSSVMNKIFFLMTKLAELGIFHFKASQALRCICFFDLVLEGLEQHRESTDLYQSFCMYMDCYRMSCPPQEIRQRIGSYLLDGLARHEINLECQESGRSVLEWFCFRTVTVCTRKNKECITSKVAPFGCNRPAAAA